MTPLAERRFRANPEYALCTDDHGADGPADRSPADERIYGRLRPSATSRLAARFVSPETALLFLTLREEGPIPEYFRSAFGASAPDRLLRLVLDEVIQVRHGETFVSGPAAASLLLGGEAYAGKGRLAEISIEALRYVDALGDLAVEEATGRLYGFGRRPMTRARRRRFDHAGTAAAGSIPDGARQSLDRYWARADSGNPYWMMWRPKRSREGGERARFKLYVSPGLDHVAEAFEASSDIVGSSSGACGLKLGRGSYGLARPDKMVAYFSRLDDLQKSGLRLRRRLEGCPVHGVAFTAALSPDGLLSWGADLPEREPGRPGSWRLWVAGRLALHLETARRSGFSGPRWRFALDRLRLDGVDPDRWTPTASFWSQAPIPA